MSRAWREADAAAAIEPEADAEADAGAEAVADPTGAAAEDPDGPDGPEAGSVGPAVAGLSVGEVGPFRLIDIVD